MSFVDVSFVDVSVTTLPLSDAYPVISDNAIHLHPHRRVSNPDDRLFFDADIPPNVNSVANNLAEPNANSTLASLAKTISNVGVNNISTYSPSVDELRVLALGLNFIPEPHDITNLEIYQALDEFTDTLLWKEQLDYTGSGTHKDTSNSAVSQLRRKLRKKLYNKRTLSKEEYKIKEKSYVKSFETNDYIHQVRQRFSEDISHKRVKTHHRLNEQESKDIDAILWDLRNNQLIVIKPADKNLGPTIMDRKWYIEAGELILKDTSTYTTLESFSINSIRNELIFILASFNHLKLKDTSPTSFMYTDWKNEPLQTLKNRYISYTSELADILLEPFMDTESSSVWRRVFCPVPLVYPSIPSKKF